MGTYGISKQSEHSFVVIIKRVLPVLLTIAVAVIAFTLTASADIPTPAGYSDHDFQALMAFYKQNDNAGKLGWNLSAHDTWNDDTKNEITWNDANPKRVKYINFWNNNLTGKLDVSGFTALELLDCDYNQLTQLDVSGCTALEWLFCDYNQLIQLDVSGCTALQRLECDGNQLTALNVLGCAALKDLHCYNNQLTQLDV